MLQIQNHISDIAHLCGIHNVKHLYVFGSALTDHFSSKSDVDLIVDFLPISPDDYVDNYFDFKFSLEGILKRSVDLIEEKAVKNPFFMEAIEQKKELLYGA